MMCITSRVGETGSSLGDCGALNTCVETTACGWVGSFSVKPEQEPPCQGLGCAMYVRAPCHRHICKTFLLSQDFLLLSFSLPHEEGLSAQEISVLIFLNPLAHGETDGSSMCSVWVCFFIFVLWFNTAFSAHCQKGHCQEEPTPTLNSLPYISSMSALPDEIWRRGLSQMVYLEMQPAQRWGQTERGIMIPGCSLFWYF